MKAKLLILFICSLFILSGNSNLSAQVTIGSGIPPERGALLDHKETDTTNPDPDKVASLENATKGVLYPKVFLYDAAKLTPLYGGTDNGTGVWSDNATADEKLKATGMVVYNVNEDAINMDEGLYMWHMDEWVKLNQDGAAVIKPVDCSAVRINGSYIEGAPVNSNDYLEIDLDVTKKGSFTISVLSGNGYSFYYTGVALAAGKITVKVPAQGTPALVKPNPDKLAFRGISLVSGCEPEITVQEKIAEYDMLCSSTVVQGQYLKNSSLVTGTHVITMFINVSQPGSYNIYTETKNGIYFKASGSFAGTGRQTVTLQGYGKPTLNEDIQLIIKANTALSSLECSAIIPITLPAMRYAVIGATNVYTWNGGPRESALTDAVNFGTNGIIKMASPLSSLWKTNDRSAALGYLRNGYLENGVYKYPDIVLYFSYGATPTTDLAVALYNYVNAGGCLIFATADYNSSSYTANDVNLLINGLFGINNLAARQTGGGSDNVYQITNNSTDPIINGPFGNLAGMYWGEDNTSENSFVLTSLPPNSVQICTAQSTSKQTIDSDISIVWYNNSKNFVYFGDSTGATTTSTGSSGYPTIFSGNKPKSKVYGPGTTNNRVVYNSALELNAVAWAIRKAAVSGINPW